MGVELNQRIALFVTDILGYRMIKMPTYPREKIVAPQTDKFELLFRLLHEVAQGDESSAWAEAVGVSRRHLNYALHALRFLDLLDSDNVPTRRGRILADRDELDAESWNVLAAAVRDSRAAQTLAPGAGTVYFNLSREQVAQRIMDLTGSSRATAYRRAGTLLAWHDQLLQTYLPLHSHTTTRLRPMDIQFSTRIGEGAHGEVWRGVDQLDRDLAVKFLFEEMRAHHDLVADARALCRLDHPNVVRVISVEELRPPLASTLPREATTAIVMQYVEGRKLSHILDEGLVAGEDVARIATGLIQGFKALHSVGVVHEDLHTGNVLVSETTVKIIDPYYQKTMRADSPSSQKRRYDSDVRALKHVLASLARQSANGTKEWGDIQEDFWQCESLHSVDECFISYLLSVQVKQDIRPERGEQSIPIPGGQAVSNYTLFIRNLGFEDDPFYHTNAANESRLSRYFVRPPYFRSLQADANRPSSGVIFAPRGSGKTAQALMLQTHAHSVGVLPVIYDRFPNLKKSTTKTPELDYHLLNVARDAISLMFLYMESAGIGFSVLGEDLLRAAGTLAFRLIPQLDARDIARIRTNPYVHGDTVDSLLNSIVSSGRQPGDFLLKHWQDRGLAMLRSADPLRGANAIDVVKAVAGQLRFVGISILVDRVDEAEFASNNSEKTFRLVESIVTDLQLFDDLFVGWKVFLWDQCKPHLAQRARTDRLQVFDVAWNAAELNAMLSSRLRAFSSGAIDSLNQIALSECAEQLARWPFLFANLSPRNLIRILQNTVVEQIEIDPSSSGIGIAALERGVRAFCNVNSQEVTERNQRRLLGRLGRATFTIKQLAESLKEERESSRGKVLSLESAGVVRQLGTIKLKSGIKASNYYMIREPSVVAMACSSDSIATIVESKTHICAECHSILFTENEDREDDLACPDCGSTAWTDEYPPQTDTRGGRKLDS